jgi:hypothetical protein
MKVLYSINNDFGQENGLKLLKQNYEKINWNNYTYKIIDKPIVCHELIHSFQYEEYGIFNKITTDKITKSLNISKYTKHLYLNPNLAIPYLFSNLTVGYDHNPYENEANFFSK